MTTAREIRIHVTHSGGSNPLQLSVSLGANHHTRQGLKWVALKTWTRSAKAPYVSELSPAFAAELIRMVTLVAAGFYETEPLPFE